MRELRYECPRLVARQSRRNHPPRHPAAAAGTGWGCCTDAAHCSRGSAAILPPGCPSTSPTLTEAELLDLNRRIVERLELIRSARQLTQLAHFSVGMEVELATDDGRTIRGTVARLNRQTATVGAPQGSWRVSPSLLRPASGASPRIVPMPDRSGRR
ncbi:MAG: hypothetical protein H0X67_16325 [Acidobacteria bacterium]|nr:hypothetical protein [Acidobacteriota bacterium]